jgi:hypothetical protein
MVCDFGRAGGCACVRVVPRRKRLTTRSKCFSSWPPSSNSSRRSVVVIVPTPTQMVPHPAADARTSTTPFYHALLPRPSTKLPRSSTKPFYQALLFSPSTKPSSPSATPFYQAVLPSRSTKPFYQAVLPSPSIKPFCHALLPCPSTVLLFARARVQGCTGSCSGLHWLVLRVAPARGRGWERTDREPIEISCGRLWLDCCRLGSVTLAFQTL